MAPAKRKATTAADATGTATTKRLKKAVEPTASSSRPSRTSLASAAAPRSTRSSISGKSAPEKSANNATKASVDGKAKKPVTKTATKAKATNSRKRGKSTKANTDEEEAAVPDATSTVLIDVPTRKKPAVTAEAEEEGEIDGEGPAYCTYISESFALVSHQNLSRKTLWRSNIIFPLLKSIDLLLLPQRSNADSNLCIGLMKAEPESRIEKGKDVKFSIDDLEAASEPEKWDGTFYY